MSSFFVRFIPFIFLGIMIVLFVAGLILLSYLLIFGAMVGFCLFVIASIRNFFTYKTKNLPAKKNPSNRIIDHDDKL